MNNTTMNDQLPLDEPQFLTTQEVMDRYKIKSKATLWKWRQSLGFPKPVHNGRHYELKQLAQWDEQQRAA